MPFLSYLFYLNKKITHNNKIKSFTEHQTSPFIHIKNLMVKRVSVSASMTLEAALVIPIFTFAVVVFIYMMMIMNFQVKVNKALYNTARSMSKYSYAHENSQITNLALATAGVIHDTGLSDIEALNIVGGAAGFHFLLSDFSDNNIDIVANYTVKFPFPVIGKIYINFTQRARTRAYVGCAYSNDEVTEKYVYITPYGQVYHIRKDCPYIKLTITEVESGRLETLRNHSGELYTQCEICKPVIYENEKLYITEYGDKYHAWRNCSGLKRGIIRINIEQAGDKRPCSKCGSADE